MRSKDQILSKLRNQSIPAVELPTIASSGGEAQEWITFEDPAAKFCEMVNFAGGSACELSSPTELAGKLAEFEEWKSAERIFSAVPEVPGNVNLGLTPDAHELENLDFVVYPGEFAVAENGAIWLTDRDLRHRVVFFITQFLVLVVSRETVVQNMHEAYERAIVPQPGFGLFLSGPSKTADIEQSLVIGAHGCRELQVYLI